MATQAVRLRRLIQHLGLSDRAFARKAGVSSALVTRIIKGDRASTVPSASIVLGAFHALGLKPDYWHVEGDPDPAQFVLEKPPKDDAVGELAVNLLDGDDNDIPLDSARVFSERIRDRVLVELAGRNAPSVGAVIKQRELPEELLTRWAARHPMDEVLARIAAWWVEQLLDLLDVPKLGGKLPTKRTKREPPF